jgi:hypothetical protein
VTDGKVGVVVIGGLNPALRWRGGPGADGQALAMLQDYVALSPIETFVRDKAFIRLPVFTKYPPSREINQNLAYPPIL